ncbi:MAG: histidine ammonia-lyase [Bacteroidetes bacterium RIFOXYA12_FULL_35_11]|nr:MAG: histidine ammonia-lyase [Bacteroidetes bacterium RIFOXYA12_FULL_35_11]
MKPHKISVENLTYRTIFRILRQGLKLELSKDSVERILKCRNYLDKKIAESKVPLYGINTGFGSLCDHTISNADLETLQRNLVVSHACGLGERVPERVIKLMLLLKIQSLSYGHSGIQLATVQRLIDFFNNDILPVIYQQGSLGASGDLAPLAHLSLPLLGLGEVLFEGAVHPTEEIYQKFGWESVKLKSKEGLALLNGTQYMSAFGVSSMLKTFRISELADIIGALSLDVFDGRIEPFCENIQSIRHHKGQMQTAETISLLLEGSQLIEQDKQHLQDPYSFRCIPQVHGASKDAINYVSQVVQNEINSVTDNPTIFPDDDQIISGGNFHGQPLAIAYDFLAIDLSELGNISERRTYQLLGGKRGLPHFLVANPGLNSGLMIPQYTAASIVNQNKLLCTPASVDSIESSQGQEDHVSMGANAASKMYKVVENTERILAIELLNAAQALEFRRPLKTSPFLEKFIERYRTYVPFIENDKILYTEINKTVEFLRTVEFQIPDELVDRDNADEADDENDKYAFIKKSWFDRISNFTIGKP